MSNKVVIGGDRLGTGKKETVSLKNYERSTHDLSYIWRSTMASGTLVPFMSEVALPGDNFDISLDCDIKTHPTIGPLFGSYKVQLDVFAVPVRLYNGKLHMNMLNIGLKMADIKLPQIVMTADGKKVGDNDQINASCIFSYLNIRGLGTNFEAEYIKREFNAIPYLAYWDIYKNYYANKQEEIGAYIHNDQSLLENSIIDWAVVTAGQTDVHINSAPPLVDFIVDSSTKFLISFLNENEPIPNSVRLLWLEGTLNNVAWMFESVSWNANQWYLECKNPKPEFQGTYTKAFYDDRVRVYLNSERPKVETFPLSNIDDMRTSILQAVNSAAAFEIRSTSDAPYGTPLQSGAKGYCKLSTQEGLGLKTYQSDLFNNWISTEWIDGENGVNSITAIDTSAGSFSIDTLQLSRKVYDMLNRIAISGGSYDDWLNAVYTHERTRSTENPMYMGGLIKELAFQEVISNASAASEDITQPLGTLAGKGSLTKKHKGGKIHIRVDEPSYIMGIVSLTPRIDYSQGNKWDVNLKTMDDFHKPALDEIGFQDLITDQMAWFDTTCNEDGILSTFSAGKQPAWLNYMTNVNQTRGNFAEENSQMFMTLNRRYEQDNHGRIKDLTTYIDPSKFNNIFADTRLDAQNFWTQIAVNIESRRKLSARLMPNL